jgi:hypothetical protein
MKKPFAEFEVGWEKKSSNPNIIEYYGTWPDAGFKAASVLISKRANAIISYEKGCLI